MARLGRRIVIGGTSGSGKTYLAKALAARLDVPYISNDEIIWRPNWTPTPRPERLPLFDEATGGPAWTLDGNFASLKDAEDPLVLGRADTLIWLDLPRRVVMRQLLWRTIARAATRRELWHGNRESWRMSFASRESILLWAHSSYEHYRAAYAKVFADPDWAHLARIRLTSRRAVNRLLRDVAAATADQPTTQA